MGACKLSRDDEQILKATRYEDAKKLLFEGYYKQMQSARKKKLASFLTLEIPKCIQLLYVMLWSR